MSQTLQAVRGMNDILPDEAEFWELFEDTIRSWLKGYGYRPIRLPIVEPTPLFKRAIGEVTDIVEKEMYSFIDSLNGEALTLRPEGTAGCVRAVIQHNLAAPDRSASTTSARCSATSGRKRALSPVSSGRRRVLRYCRPGYRCRNDPDGRPPVGRSWAGRHRTAAQQPRPAGRARQHRAALIAYFEENAELLDEDAKRRLHTNPLRILDTKNPAMQD
jgi:histidyl-tRNA synthetase